MTNQSLVSLPPDLTDPIVLRRFLARLVEQLDVILGNKAGPQNQYANQEQLQQIGEDLRETLRLAQLELAELIRTNQFNTNLDLEALDDRIAALENENYTTDDFGVVSEIERI